MNTCGKTALILMLALGVGRSAVALAPWVTDEERAFVKRRVMAMDTLPGTPEGDAKRF